MKFSQREIERLLVFCYLTNCPLDGVAQVCKKEVINVVIS